MSVGAPLGRKDFIVPFRHEALLYDGDEAFVTSTAAFVREGLTLGEPVLVVVDPDKTALLRDELGSDAGEVRFADMADLGRNPSRIIPAWRDFVDGQPAGRTTARWRGIGDPVGGGRPPDALVECQRHEALLNLAFVDASLWLLCPYDTGRLTADVIAEAERSHPYLWDGHDHAASDGYAGLDELGDPFAGALREPAVPVERLTFDLDHLDELRRTVGDHATASSLAPMRVADLVLAVSEAAANSLRHGGGQGELRWWADDRVVVCEVRDRGHVVEPLAGRVRPGVEQPDGRGLWIAHQVCDLVEVRSGPDGTVVRMTMERP
jgi:anti-sigma regulatory factor (Ser/Thr protein kinase)